MAVENQQSVVEGLGRIVGQMCESFIIQLGEKYLSAIDSILSDPDITSVEKIGMIKVITDDAWKRMAAISYSDSSLSPEDVARIEVKE